MAVAFHILDLRSARLSDAYGSMDRINQPKYLEPECCPGCGNRLRSRKGLRPHKYRVEYGGPGDFVAGGNVYAFSERVVQAFRASALTGLTFSKKPIELVGAEDTYYLAEPVCNLTLLDEPKCGIIIDEVRGCDRCRVMSMKKLERVVIREDTWDGADVFMCGTLMNLTIVTQRFVDFIREHEFTNFHFIPQASYSEDWTFGGKI